jgi:four helix bundle protein
MALDHTKLDVYHRAVDLLDQVDQIYDAMPPGRAHLKDQLDRAATSIVLNIAEGAGEFSKDEKQRFYRIARRSATETPRFSTSSTAARPWQVPRSSRRAS